MDSKFTALESAKKLSEKMDELLKKSLPHDVKKEGWTLFATGSYGRCELSPYSDLDILVILQDRERHYSWLEPWLLSLWDQKLRPGHAVRTLEETLDLAQKNVQVLSSMMEARFIEGDPKISETFQKEKRIIVSQKSDLSEVVEAKFQERTDRLLRNGKVTRTQQPHLKDGRGGLRDLQLIRFLSLLQNPEKNDWESVAKTLSRSQALELKAILNWFMKLREDLHRVHQRSHDILTHGDQRALAASLRIRPTKSFSPVEKLMTQYYRHTDFVNSCVDEMIERTSDLKKKKDSIDLRSLQEEIQIFHDELQRDPKVFHKRIRYWNQRFRSLVRSKITTRSLSETRTWLWKTMQESVSVAPIFRVLEESGCLIKLFPVWRYVQYRVQNNFLHAYSVDEHLLRTLRYADEVIETKSVERRGIFRMAALLHDIGKGSSEDHSLVGVRRAKSVMDLMNITPSDQNEITFLIENHLLMSHVAQRKDIDDPRVLRAFLSKIKTRERLYLLRYLTEVDMRATGPEVYSSWKEALLNQLLENGIRWFSDRGDPFVSLPNLRSQQAEALKGLRAVPFSEKSWSIFLRKFDGTYLRKTRIEEILQDDQDFQDLLSQNGIILRKGDVKDGTIEVSIVTRDQSGLFHWICAHFDSLGLSVRSAKIYTRRDGLVIDRFSLDHPQEVLRRWRKLQEQMCALRESLTLPIAKKRRLHPKMLRPDVPREIIVRDKTSRHRLVLEISTEDRQGVLADIALVLKNHHLSVHQAHILTEGVRALDIFYVLDERRNKKNLSQERKRKLITDLKRALA